MRRDDHRLHAVPLRRCDLPHVVQVYEIGSQLALDAGIFTPVGEVEGGDDARALGLGDRAEGSKWG